MTLTPGDARAGAGGAGDGVVLEPARVADHLAIQDLAAAYAHALDDRDWARWEALFTPHARIDHIALTVTDVDLDAMAASGRFAVEMGPADLFGAQGVGRGLYLSDPDGNRVELRTYG